MKHTEIEFKWEANAPRAFGRVRAALAAAGTALGKPRDLSITDYYVDTPARDFKKQQIAMRLRRTDQRWEVTFKTRTELVAGKAIRREETCQLPGVKNFRDAVQALQNKKTWKRLEVSQLDLLFVLTNKRRIYPATLKNTQAELAFDKCCLSVCGRRVMFKEVELELKRGSVQTLEKLAVRITQKTALRPARISKVKTAVALLHLWGEE